MAPPNAVRVTLAGFKCEYCGQTGSATPGAIMSAFMREVIAFENKHKACSLTGALESSKGSGTTNSTIGTDWLGKDNLPSASELHALLKQGTSCRVNGHSLSPDEHGVWITSPYGIDCGLWQALTLQRVERFLADMAADKECGLVP